LVVGPWVTGDAIDIMRKLLVRRWPTEKWKCTVCSWVYDPEQGDS